MTDFLHIKPPDHHNPDHNKHGKPVAIETQWHCHGKSDNPVLVFLHEGLGCVRLWKDFPERLSRLTQCNAFVYSRMGYGRSAPAPLPRKLNFMHTEALTLLPRVLDAAHIRQYILIGHSDGGSIGLIHGGSLQARGLAGIITLAAHLFCEPITLDSIQAAKKQYLFKDLKEKLAVYHGKNTDTAFWGWNDVWLSPKFIHWNIEKYLKHIKVPVLALQGREDPYGSIAQLRAMKSGTKDCRPHLIDHCKHAPHHEQKTKTMELMAQFILKNVRVKSNQ